MITIGVLRSQSYSFFEILTYVCHEAGTVLDPEDTALSKTNGNVHLLSLPSHAQGNIQVESIQNNTENTVNALYTLAIIIVATIIFTQYFY